MIGFIKKYVLFIILGGFIIGGITIYAPKFLTAQTFDQQASANDSSGERSKMDVFDESMEEAIFPDTINGCVSRFKFSTVVFMQYQAGKSVNEFAQIKALEPMINDIYSDIREVGLAESKVKAMKTLNDCMEKGGKVTRAAIRDNYKGCAALNDVLLDVIDSIKRRQKLETVAKRYESNAIDLIDTGYEDIEDPLFFFIGVMYKAAKSDDMNKVAQTAHSLSMRCFI